jgi:hypothetical protein
MIKGAAEGLVPFLVGAERESSTGDALVPMKKGFETEVSKPFVAGLGSRPSQLAGVAQ